MILGRKGGRATAFSPECRERVFDRPCRGHRLKASLRCSSQWGCHNSSRNWKSREPEHHSANKTYRPDSTIGLARSCSVKLASRSARCGRRDETAELIEGARKCRRRPYHHLCTSSPYRSARFCAADRGSVWQ